MISASQGRLLMIDDEMVDLATIFTLKRAFDRVYRWQKETFKNA